MYNKTKVKKQKKHTPMVGIHTYKASMGNEQGMKQVNSNQIGQSYIWEKMDKKGNLLYLKKTLKKT